MQWLFDIVLEMVAKAGYALKSWVIAQAYATQAWVEAKTYATIAMLIELDSNIREWVEAKGYATELWVHGKNYTTLAEVLARIRGTRFHYRRAASTQIIPTGTWTKVQLNTSLYDVETEWDAPNYRWIAKETNYYQINFGVGFRPGIPDGYFMLGAIRINDALQQTIQAHSSGLNYVCATGSNLFRLFATDYVELWCYHNAGVNVNLDYTSFMNYLSIFKVLE